MIAISIREQAEPSPDGQGERFHYEVASFRAPRNPNSDLRPSSFKSSEGSALATILDEMLDGSDRDTLAVGLAGSAVKTNREPMGRGATMQDLRRSAGTWGRRNGFETDDELRSQVATFANGTEEYVTFGTRASLLRLIRGVAAKHNMTLEAIRPLAYGWAAALPSVHMLLDTTAIDKEIVLARVFTPPTASELAIRADDDLLSKIEEGVVTNQRRGHFTVDLLNKIHRIGRDPLPFAEAVRIPIVPLDTDLPAEFHSYIGLLGLAGYTA